MTTYNDFIADLTSEDLLDGGKINLPKGQDDFLFSKFSVPLRVVESSSAQFSVEGSRQFKLPDFSFLQNDFQVEETSELAFVELENELKPLQNPTFKRKVKKAKKSGKYCDICNVRVAAFRLRCRFCHQTMVSGFIYYPLILFSVITISALMVLFIIYRNYFI